MVALIEEKAKATFPRSAKVTYALTQSTTFSAHRFENKDCVQNLNTLHSSSFSQIHFGDDDHNNDDCLMSGQFCKIYRPWDFFLHFSY